ncbi:MAG: hypothetical protein IPM54_32455 [Polyangiaceae bacterium]|nr:hypothetical protein [Polyangiaceae bacterium]
MKLSRTRSFGLGASFVAVVLAACAPDSTINRPTTTGTGGASGSGSSSGMGGDGGILFFDSGNACADPTDKDKDLIADSLEKGPDHDTNGDGSPDALDDDADGDGVLDKDEAANPFLPPDTPGQARDDSCDPLADTDGDGDPDVRDLDSDNDGVPDKQESAYDPDGTKGCRVSIDCDKDGVIDVIEVAANSDPTSEMSVPADAGLYFVLPYQEGEQTKDFTFSTGIAKADIYFMIDTTASMQPAIDNLKASIDTEIIPTILNGDPAANPPIPAIDDAWIGVGEFRDVPWLPYGENGDQLYRYQFNINAQTVKGDMAPPVFDGQKYSAPAATKTILGALTAGGGGDAPEATTQALWLAAKNDTFALTIGGIWNPGTPYSCALPGGIGIPCFRPGGLPIFVMITDAAFHNGSNSNYNYDPTKVGGTVKSYLDTVNALKSIHAKVVGVPVSGNNPNAARLDLTDLAIKTDSTWYDPQFGGKINPLVPTADVGAGNVSKEVVRLLGRLAGAGLQDVTTSRTNYSCAGDVDCTGDGMPDAAYENPVVDVGPFDASTLITKIATVESAGMPLPYSSRSESTFFGLRGNAPVTFRVHAENTTVKPPSLLVMRALIRVETPAGQVLGGKNGIKLVYFVIPQYIPKAN